jgi:hypothetical protein
MSMAWITAIAALAALALVAGCGQVAQEKEAPGAPGQSSAQPLVPTAHGEAARAVSAIGALARALRDGDVERLCRPNAIFTAAVVADNDVNGQSCESAVELSSAVRRPPALTVTALASRPDLATARVRVGQGRTVRLDLVRDGPRWLVSFSDGVNPLAVL